MPSAKELSHLLEAFSPAQLDRAAASLNRIRDQEPFSDLDDQPNAPSEVWPSMDLSIDPNNFVVVDCNQASVDTLGASPLGKYFVSLIDPEYRGAAIEALAILCRHKEIKHVRLRFLRPGTDSVPVMMAAHGVEGVGERLALIRLFCQNITPLKQIANIEAFSEMLSTGIALVDNQGRIAFVNRAAEKMFGYEHGELEEQRALIFAAGQIGDFTWDVERDEVTAHPTVFKLYGAKPVLGPVPGTWFRAHHHPDDTADTQKGWLDRLSTEGQHVLEFRINGDDGLMRWVECHGIAVRDAAGKLSLIHGLSVDITQRKLAELAAHNAEKHLRMALREKEAMLREIHHRVKNNLQIVSHLLGMQADNAAGSQAEAALRESERRIATMAMVHEQLYGTEDLCTVEMSDQVAQLSESLLASLAETSRVTCRMQLNRVALTIHQAIPCALILNELLTNALKHAYPNGAGQIDLYLSCVDDRVTLRVSDNGIGLPSTVDPWRPKTLGLEIVQALANQLAGELTIGGGPGASFVLRFTRQRDDIVEEVNHKDAAAGAD